MQTPISPNDGPEVRKLLSRLCDRDGIEVVAFKVDWGPEAAAMTVEERAAEINKALDGLESGDFDEVTDDDDL